MIKALERPHMRGTEVISKKILQTINDKVMKRKDFLKYSGLVLISLVGLKGLVTILTQKETVSTLATTNSEKPSSGFGGGKYGA